MEGTGTAQQNNESIFKHQKEEETPPNRNHILLRVHVIDSRKISSPSEVIYPLRPSFFNFLFYRFFSQQVSVGGRNKNKIRSDHFPIELKSKETQFPSILIQLENSPNELYFTN